MKSLVIIREIDTSTAAKRERALKKMLHALAHWMGNDENRNITFSDMLPPVDEHENETEAQKYMTSLKEKTSKISNQMHTSHFMDLFACIGYAMMRKRLVGPGKLYKQ